MGQMRRIAGGEFWMGSDRHYPEEGPARRVQVDPFLIDVGPVTNAEFASFVAATGHVTLAERAPDPAQYPEADPALLKPGSAVFTPPNAPVATADPFLWWAYVQGADWRHPRGPQSSIDGLDQHPVVHVAAADAEAYARWADKRLPTEAEWECAARGGLDRAAYAWGDELATGGRRLANYWRGRFPHENLDARGPVLTSPVGAFPANGFGLHDMIGNVWEWTSDWYAMPQAPASPCCVPSNPRGGSEAASRDPNDPGRNFGRRVLKGGSHLCAENYCRRYRPAARYPQTIDTTTSHIGFRCARTPEGDNDQGDYAQ
jgi:formylglycine-generating enzyme required for sulfatase activity